MNSVFGPNDALARVRAAEHVTATMEHLLCPAQIDASPLGHATSVFTYLLFRRQ